MLRIKKRKSLIIKYLQKSPLSSKRKIRTNHAEHEYHSKYLEKYLDELIQEKKIDTILERYYVIPESGREIDLLINIIKSVSLTKPKFSNLNFKKNKDSTIKTIINNCICLYHLKLKINNLENRISQDLFNQNFIKFLKTFSDDNNYTEFMVDKNFFKDNPLWKIKIESYNTLEKRILNFLQLYWGWSFEYYTHLKNNRISLNKIFSRIFQQYNEGKSITAEDLGITNKALKRSLDQIITEQGTLTDFVEYDSDMNLIKTSRPQILQMGIGILGHRLPSKRKKYAKIVEEMTGIPYTKLIPLDGYSSLLKDAPKEPKPLDPNIEKKYVKDLEKNFGVPHIKIIPKNGEPYYQIDDSLDPSKDDDN